MSGMDGNGIPDADFDASGVDGDLLEEELRQAAGVLDPVPVELRQLALEAYALHDLDARIAELTFDSLVDALPVRGVPDAPRMLTFRAGGLTVDVEVTGEGLSRRSRHASRCWAARRRPARSASTPWAASPARHRPPDRSRCGCGPAGR